MLIFVQFRKQFVQLMKMTEKKKVAKKKKKRESQKVRLKERTKERERGREKKRERKRERAKVGDNNGQATHGACMAHASRLGQFWR